MRIITECYWRGYRASQDKVVHRTVHQGKSPYRNISWIQFTDGTGMAVSHREAKPHEKVKEIHGYDVLLRDCVCAGMTGRCEVSKLRGLGSPVPAMEASV